MTEKQTLIDSFEKNSREIVKVHVQEWRGNRYIDLRSWLLPDESGKGADRPTPKGLTLNVELIPRLIEALQRADEIVSGGPGQDGDHHE
jgi:hypothetical protein